MEKPEKETQAKERNWKLKGIENEDESKET